MPAKGLVKPLDIAKQIQRFRGQATLQQIVKKDKSR